VRLTTSLDRPIRPLAVAGLASAFLCATLAFTFPRAARSDAQSPRAAKPDAQNPAVVPAAGVVDPDGRNLFDDWQKPQAVIVFSGQQHGYLEPCGCSPEFQKGGLARRFGFVKSLQQRQWPLVMVDLGGLLEGQPPPTEGKVMVGPEQKQVKLETALQALHTMGYTAINLAPEDIEGLGGFVGLMGLLINIGTPPMPYAINANVGVSKDWNQNGLHYSYVVREVGGARIAFIGMVGKKYKDQMQDPEFAGWEPPEKILPGLLREVKGEKQAAHKVLMLYGDLEEARDLANQFQDLDVIIYSSEREEPDAEPIFVKKTMLVTVGWKGKYTGTIGIFRTEPRMRFVLAPLDDRFEEDTAIRELLDAEYVRKLKELDLVSKYPRQKCDPENPELGFVGSKKCGECHENVFKYWQTTRHSHALETLVEGFKDQKLNKQIAGGKQVNPECVSCHTTGFFKVTGYDGTEKTAHLGGNGCENCHGPGSVHAKMMSNPDISPDDRREAKKMMHLGPQDEKRNVCITCHDAENSPKFDLGKYWDQIDHGAEAAEDVKNWPKILEKLRQK
jgi:hypothetical protein